MRSIAGSVKPCRCRLFHGIAVGYSRSRPARMKLPTFITAAPPLLTPSRVRLAYATAVATDALQFVLGPIGWVGADEILDVAATALIWRLLGFHPLLLPTFLVELLPMTDMLPTWTGCVALVIGQRRRQQIGPPPPGDGPIIDV
jgi:hypothetical protein